MVDKTLDLLLMQGFLFLNLFVEKVIQAIDPQKVEIIQRYGLAP